MDTGEVQVMLRKSLDILQNVRKRPEMYFSPITPMNVENWLYGLRVGLGIAGVQWSVEALKSACSQRGIEFTASTNLIDELAKQGKSSEDIAMVLVEIAEDMWRRILTGLA